MKQGMTSILCPFPKEEFENEIYLPSVKATCPASFVMISNVSIYAVCVLKTLDKFIIGFGEEIFYIYSYLDPLNHLIVD